MKKSFILILAALLVVAFTLPASAFENIFGGYWRTRVWTQQNFTGDEDVDSGVDLRGNPIGEKKSLVDTRTRLYYTAKFSENVQFVNRFEFDADWGDDSIGDLGTDGTAFEIKNSYLDMRLGETRWTVGMQGAALARGFIFGDDFAGLIARYQPGTTQDLLIPFIWIKAAEEFGATTNSEGDVINGDGDVNIFGLYPFFPMGAFTLNPYIHYFHTDTGALKDNDWYYIGLDVDGKTGDLGWWGTFIYQGGDVITGGPGGPEEDLSAYLFAIGGNAPVGPLALRGQFFWASGDENISEGTANDGDYEAFLPIGMGTQGVNTFHGASYYWAEILGQGIFDDFGSAGTSMDKISNIWAFNVGSDFNITEGSKLAVDLWYASLVEDNPNGDTNLGFELDLVYTVNLIENVNLDLVGAYLFAGDATVVQGQTSNEDDPWLLGSRLSFSF